MEQKANPSLVRTQEAGPHSSIVWREWPAEWKPKKLKEKENKKKSFGRVGNGNIRRKKDHGRYIYFLGCHNFFIFFSK
jgi:hypothetical protein